MSKKKLQRFAETATFPNFIQDQPVDITIPFRLRGKWNKEHFGRDGRLTLELGCGKGEYTVGLARRYPENNYIGIDIKGARMWRGAKTALEEKLNNAAFLRTQIGSIGRYFGPAEIDELWITFPDPFSRQSKASRRLTSPRFLRFYAPILKPDHLIHLKTDDTGLYEYTLEVINAHNHKLYLSTDNLYRDYPREEVAQIQTFYEAMWLAEGKTIKYLRFSLNPQINANG